MANMKVALVVFGIITIIITSIPNFAVGGFCVYIANGGDPNYLLDRLPYNETDFDTNPGNDTVLDVSKPISQTLGGIGGVMIVLGFLYLFTSILGFIYGCKCSETRGNIIAYIVFHVLVFLLAFAALVAFGTFCSTIVVLLAGIRGLDAVSLLWNNAGVIAVVVFLLDPLVVSLISLIIGAFALKEIEKTVTHTN